MTKQPSAEAEGRNGGAPAAKTGAKTKRKHILIVDNNPVMGRILGKMVERAGMKFSIAQKGEEAIGFCETTNYDLILLEARMPELDGLATAKRIRALGARNTQVPIIAVGTKFSDKMVQKNREAGVTAELKKPVIEFNLLQTLSEQLGISTRVSNMHPPEDDEIYAVLDEDEMTLLNWDTLNEYNAVLKGEYKTLMRDFLIASPDLIGDIGEAVVDKNSKKIEFLAHKLKSTSLIFGAEGVSTVAAQLEMLGRQDDLEHAGQYYKELHMSFERIKPVLRKKLVLMNSAF